MTHDELLAEIKIQGETSSINSGLANALRAVVELHKPKEGVWWISNPNLLACSVCEETLWDSAEPMLYPCPTVQAIEKELK